MSPEIKEFDPTYSLYVLYKGKAFLGIIIVSGMITKSKASF